MQICMCGKADHFKKCLFLAHVPFFLVRAEQARGQGRPSNR